MEKKKGITHAKEKMGKVEIHEKADIVTGRQTEHWEIERDGTARGNLQTQLQDKAERGWMHRYRMNG